MVRRIIAFLLSVLTAVINIWRPFLEEGTQLPRLLVIVLAFVSLILLIYSLTPLVRWLCSTISFLWRMWRKPKGLFIQNLSANFVPNPPEGDPYWLCGYDIISTLPWQIMVSVDLEIRDPRELAGIKGHMDVNVGPLRSTPVNLTPFTIGQAATQFLKVIYGQGQDHLRFLPLRILVNVKDARGRPLIVGQSVNYVLQY